MLPGGCGTLEPREGSQRHLGLTRTTWLWGQDGNLAGARSHRCPPRPGSLQPGQPPPPTSPKAPKQAQGQPRAIQSCSGQAECVREVAGHAQHRDIGCWQWFGDSHSASIPQPRRSCHPKEAVDGAHLHVWLATQQRNSTGKRWSTADTTRTSTKPPPKHPQQLGLPSAPSLGPNWHRIPSYPAILIPVPCLDQSSLLSSRIVFGKANERPARHGLPVSRSCSPSADVPAAGQGQALSHPSTVSPAAGTISHPGHQPVTSFLSLWSQDSGFADKFGKSKQSSARTLSSDSSRGATTAPSCHRCPCPLHCSPGAASRIFPHPHRAVSVHRPR